MDFKNFSELNNLYYCQYCLMLTPRTSLVCVGCGHSTPMEEYRDGKPKEDKIKKEKEG